MSDPTDDAIIDDLDFDDDEVEVEDPLELFSRLFQTDDGENICDVLTSINQTLNVQNNLLKVIAKGIQQTGLKK